MRMKSNMSTPIVDFLEKYKNSDISRLHMPGHKGKTYGYKNIPGWLSDAFAYDITEIKGADDLYHPGGIIKESEATASEIYGTDFSAIPITGSGFNGQICVGYRENTQLLPAALHFYDYLVSAIHPESGPA